jgi:PAS domain S-box-containing protein
MPFLAVQNPSPETDDAILGQAILGAHSTEADFRRLLNALPVAIYLTDPSGRISFYNQAAAELAGREPQLDRDRWCVTWRLFWPDGTPMRHDECPMAVALREGRSVRGVEAILERPDGVRVHFQPYPTPLYDTAGDLIGAVNMLVDITERKRAEQAAEQLNATLEQRVEERTRQVTEALTQLRDSEEQFRILVQGVTDYAIFMLDPKGFVTNWNSGAARIKGYAAEEIVGRHFSQFYTAEDRRDGIPKRALQTAKRTGRYEAEGWRIRKDGTKFWANVVIDAIHDEGQRLVGFAKVTRDVTERRKAQEALAESAGLARGIIDTALDAFVQIDQAGIVLEWNRQAAVVFGYSRREAVGKSLGNLVLRPSDRVAHRKGLQRFLRTGGGQVLGRRLQLQAVRRDGREITVELSITSLRRGDSWVFNGFVRDLTDKLAAEAQLHHAQKMEAVGQLTGGVAHDFNNLLTAIVGNLEMLASTLPPESATRRYAQGALRAALRGSQLTSQLLAFSRREDVRPEIVSLNDLLREALMLCQRTVGEGVEIELLPQEDIWLCHVDPAEFGVAVLNLAANARDAMDRSGRLTLRTDNVSAGGGYTVDLPAGDYVVLSVSDTGRGMSAEVIERAFEPFYTTKEVGKGTGLGLSQVYGFAKQAGGTAVIESRVGKGTTVRIYIPRANGKPADDVAPNESLAKAAPIGATILVVEDDADVGEMIVGILSDLGYRTLMATTGPEALAILEQDCAVDVLFTDIVMPAGMSGTELARQASRVRPGLNILLSSGYTREDISSRPGRPEFPFIAKPYRPTMLAKKLKEVLAGATL